MKQIWDEFVLTITILAIAGALLLIALAVVTPYFARLS